MPTKTPHHLYLTLLAVGIVVVGGLISYFGVQILRNVNRSAAASSETLGLVNQALKGTHKNGDDGLLVLSRVFLQNADGAANALKQTAQTVNRISKEQQPNSKLLADSSIALVNATTGTISRLNGAVGELSSTIAKVNGETLPKVNAGVDSLNGLVSDLRPAAKASVGLLTAGTATVNELKLTIGTTNSFMADPELIAIRHNFNMMSANGVVVTGNMALVTGDFHRMLNPKTRSFWQALSMTAAGSIIGPAAGSLISHWFPLGINVSNTPTIQIKP